MRVSDLEIGMLLECTNKNDGFKLTRSIGDQDAVWLTIRNYHTNRYRTSFTMERENIMLYRGTKKETNIDLMWCDKFVLRGHKIAGVDPASWRMLREVSSE